MIKSIISTGAASVIALIITFFNGVIIAHYYGPDGKGLVVLLLLIPNLIVGIFGLSSAEGLLYFLAKGKIGRSNFGKLIIKISIIFIPLSIIAYLIIPFVTDKYPYSYNAQLLLIVLLFLSELYRFSARARMQFGLYNLIRVGEAVFILLTLVTIIYFDFNIITVLWGYVIFHIISIIYAHIKIRPFLPNNNAKVRIKEITGYSYKVHFFKIFNLIENKFDLLLIGNILTINHVGIYSVSTSFSLIFQALIQTSISTVLLPKLVEGKALENKTATALKYFKISLTLAFLFGLLMVIFGKLAILLFFGDKFLGAYVPMAILMLGALIKSPAACINSYFKSIGKPEALYKSSMISVFVNVLLCLVLIPSFSIIGAAIASTISYFLFGALMIYKFKNDGNVSYSALLVNKSDFINAADLIINAIQANKRKS